MSKALWSTDAMTAALRGERAGMLPDAIAGISIDSRTIAEGEAYFAIKGDVHDGHDFVAAALKNGAGLAVVAREKREAMPPQAPLLIVADVLQALRDLAAAARARSKANIVAVTGSVGKTSTKEALRLALGADGETHASAASFNNHWGVPLSLARLPQSARHGVFEIGMNHAGEITPLVKLVRPNAAIITTIAPVHLEFFQSEEEIADAKAEIFLGVEAGGATIINRDTPHFARLAARARAAGVAKVVSFGEHPDSDAKLIRLSLQPDTTTIEADILGTPVTYKLGAPGRHLAVNSLGVLAAAALAGADLALSALALSKLSPAPGRGTRITLAAPGGDAILIDESYNANPASMRAALALLGQATVGPQGRRIAVLGDMLELGAAAADLHRALAETVADQAIDLVYCAGPMMASLWEALPSSHRGGYATSAAELEPQIMAAVQGGDAIMVKGSFGSRMSPIVKALARRFARDNEATG